MLSDVKDKSFAFKAATLQAQSKSVILFRLCESIDSGLRFDNSDVLLDAQKNRSFFIQAHLTNCSGIICHLSAHPNKALLRFWNVMLDLNNFLDVANRLPGGCLDHKLTASHGLNLDFEQSCWLITLLFLHLLRFKSISKIGFALHLMPQLCPLRLLVESFWLFSISRSVFFQFLEAFFFLITDSKADVGVSGHVLDYVLFESHFFWPPLLSRVIEEAV